MQICVLHGGNRSVLSCWDLDRRPWDRVIWLHSCSNIYIKHHTIEKYFIETSNWRCIFIVGESKWLRNQGNCRPTPEIVWKTLFTFDFHILPSQRHIGAKIIPCRCISIKNDFQLGPCRPIYWQPKPSPDCGRKIQNESNNVHIDTYSCKPELISWR